jgi:hypothetical protein
MAITFHKCPTCGSEENEPCRTPKGRKKETVHDTRPFSVSFDDPPKRVEETVNDTT